MASNGIRALWDEPRPAHAPVRVWRDWALLVLILAASAVEALLRDDRAGLPAACTVSVVLAFTVLWRRTRPLAAVGVAFGTMLAFDLARIVGLDASGLLTIGAALLLPYALARWGSGREAASGLGIILAWLVVTHVADPTGIDEMVAGYGFFLFSAALGAAIRFHDTTRARGIEEAKLRQRNELARELHDTVGHHVSAIAIQAQAGRALAASDPQRALEVLATIEQSATRTMREMRSIVGVLRDAAEPQLAPLRSITDIEGLADGSGRPRVEVHLPDHLDDVAPSVGAALYRIAQEAVTNAVCHARNADRVRIEIHEHGDLLRLTVRDDGDTTSTGDATSGYGLLGMRERTSLLGGAFRAGPGAQGGWTVEATLPRGGPDRAAGRAPVEAT